MRILNRVMAIVVLAVSSGVGCNSQSAPPVPEEVSPAVPAAANERAELPVAAAADEAAASVAPAAEAATAEPPREPIDAAEIALISRTTLFGNPDKASARISPDGSKISYLAPRDGVLNVFVGPVGEAAAARPITDDKHRGIRTYFWAYDSQHVLYIQDTNGDENWHVYSVDLATGQTKDLTPIPKVAAQIDAVSEKFPQEILVGLNDRDPQFHDVYRVNIVTGERRLLQQNTDFASFISDDDFQVRLATKMTPDGGTQYYEADGQGGWKDLFKVEMADALTTLPLGFDKSGKHLYLSDSRGRNTAALVQIDLADGKQTLLAAD